MAKMMKINEIQFTAAFRQFKKKIMLWPWRHSKLRANWILNAGGFPIYTYNLNAWRFFFYEWLLIRNGEKKSEKNVVVNNLNEYRF